MEDVDEPVMDIDTFDAKDPLAVVEYIDDIYDFYRKTEVNLNLDPKNFLSTMSSTSFLIIQQLGFLI